MSLNITNVKNWEVGWFNGSKKGAEYILATGISASLTGLVGVIANYHPTTAYGYIIVTAVSGLLGLLLHGITQWINAYKISKATSSTPPATPPVTSPVDNTNEQAVQ